MAGYHSHTVNGPECADRLTQNVLLLPASASFSMVTEESLSSFIPQGEHLWLELRKRSQKTAQNIRCESPFKFSDRPAKTGSCVYPAGSSLEPAGY